MERNLDVTTSEKMVLLAIASQLNSEGYCVPSLGELAKLTRLTKRSVTRVIKGLESAGLIRIERRRGTVSGNLSNLYRLNFVV